MGGKSILKVVLTDLLLKSLEILFKYLCIMKMKLSQRLMLKYYKAKIRTIGMVSPEKAAAEATKTASGETTGTGQSAKTLLFEKTIEYLTGMSGQ